MEEDLNLAKVPPDSKDGDESESLLGDDSTGEPYTQSGETLPERLQESSHVDKLPSMEQLDTDIESHLASKEGSDGSAASDSDKGAITIKVKLIDGKSFELQDVPLSSTVDELKTLIREETDIEEGNQRIIHHGKVLQSGQLHEHKLKDPAWIHLVFRDPNIRANTSTEETNQTEDSATRQTPEEITTSLAAIISSAIRTSNRAPTALVPGASTGAEAHPLQPREFNVEHVWQSMRMIDGLIDSYEELEPLEEREESVEGDDVISARDVKHESDGLETIFNDEDFEVVNSDAQETCDDEQKALVETDENVPSLRRFETGQWVDVLDTVNQWLEATVMQVSEDGMKIKVHYNAWGERWDEVIDIRSRRIAPFRTKTKHRRSGENLSATPVSWVKNAPRIGEGALQDLLPKALETAERSLSAFRQVCGEGSDRNKVDGLLYLAPILDRTGRMLGDIAAKLAQRPRLVPTKQVLPVWPFSVMKQSYLPLGMYIFETDKNSTERDTLLRSRRLDSDFLQLVNQQPDNSARTGNLDIHIHAIVSPGQELGTTLGAGGSAAN